MRMGGAAGLGAFGKKKPAVTAAEVAAVELDKGDEELLAQLEQEAEARGEGWNSGDEREKLKALKAEQAKQRLKKMKLGGIGGLGAFGKKKPAVTAAEVASVKLDEGDEDLLGHMELEAAERGEEFDSEEEREKLKTLKADQAKQRL